MRENETLPNLRENTNRISTLLRIYISLRKIYYWFLKIFDKPTVRYQILFVNIFAEIIFRIIAIFIEKINYLENYTDYQIIYLK